MNVLLVNDDGIEARGLQCLRKRLSRKHKVWTVAPAEQQSGRSHSITLFQPLIVENSIPRTYVVHGSPVDCVKIALGVLIKEKLEVVISGINWGANVGFNVFYSGTIAQAMEGAFYGIPSLAVSLEESRTRGHSSGAEQRAHFETAALTVEHLLESVVEATPIRRPLVLNINVPNRPYFRVRGMMTTYQAVTDIKDSFSRRKDPRGRLYFWIRRDPILVRNVFRKSGHEKDYPCSDVEALRRGYVSVTPLTTDLTSAFPPAFLSSQPS